MTPVERYQRECTRGDFCADPEQLVAIEALDKLYRVLLHTRARKARWWHWLVRGSDHAIQEPHQGLYLCGGVGRGKTMLVDLFYECIPPGMKRRIHFHSFMREVHQALNTLRGTENPLQVLAAHWARDWRVLCLDEFHVVDITDAMLLAQLLAALFAQGVTLVTTSNELPDDLYRGGLQRERFLPAITLLKSHLKVIEFRGAVDYRLRTLTQAATYYSPADSRADSALQQRYAALTHTSVRPAPSSISIEGREIATRAHTEDVAWFDFEALCDGPRSTSDYIEIACCFNTVLVSNVPRLTDDSNDATRRFINMVDEFYDRGVNLLLSAATAPEALYSGTRLVQPFRRTASRLAEMQSQEYLAKPHITEGSNSLKSDN